MVVVNDPCALSLPRSSVGDCMASVINVGSSVTVH